MKLAYIFDIEMASISYDRVNTNTLNITREHSAGIIGSITKGGQLFIHNNGSGERNTFLGLFSASDMVIGDRNTGIGAFALNNATIGESNTAVGDSSLTNNTIGSFNTAVGVLSLTVNPNGIGNTAVGHRALTSLIGGVRNIAIGRNAGLNLTTGNNNIYVGAALVPVVESDTIRIGDVSIQTAAFMAGIFGNVVPAGTTVLVNSFGQLGTIPSARRYKKNIKGIEDSSFILNIKPVEFNYKNDPINETQYGFIAEDMPESLIIRNAKGDAETIKYHLLVPLLINEVQKLHKEIEILKGSK